MKKQRNYSEEFWKDEPTYQTGSTNPPKSHGGIIAFLLALVIFLCGISTALGFMNIHLFRELSNVEYPQENAAVAFSEAAQAEAKTIDAALVEFSLGFTGQGVPDFWQLYNELPQGIYIAEVDGNSIAALGGLLPGDILTHFEGIPVPNADTLQSLLEEYEIEEGMTIDVCRDGSIITLTLTGE